MARTASKPFPHSATISTSACAARYSRSSARAGASSSTITTRRRASLIGASRAVLGRRQREDDAEALGLAEDVDARRARVQGLETLADVLEAEPVSAARRGFGIARVLDGDLEAPAVAPSLDAHGAALDAVRDAL